MNARYPGQFPNCSERQTKLEREGGMVTSGGRGRRLQGERERKGWKERRLSALLSDAPSAPERSVSVSPRWVAERRGTLRSPSSCSHLRRPPWIRDLLSHSLYLSLSRRVQPLRSARTPPRANTGQRLLRVSPSRSIFTIFTSRPGTRLPISRLHGQEKRERAALATFPPPPSSAFLIRLPLPPVRYSSASPAPRSR